jgi:CRISPR/Cas system-associated exonuclease Cas4 (RecB family)
MHENNNSTYAFSKIIDAFLQWNNSSGSEHRSYSVFHPSAFGKCLRKMQYQKYAEEGIIPKPVVIPEPRMIRIWDTGHSMHSRWAMYMEKLNILRGVWKCKYCGDLLGNNEKLGIFKPEKCDKCSCSSWDYQEITVEDKNLNMYGHCDQVLDFGVINNNFKNSSQAEDVKDLFSLLPSKPIIVDMKTIGKNQWNKIDRQAHFYYIVQLTIYLHILDLDMGIIIYERKDDSEIKMFRVERNDDMWNIIQQQAKMMISMVSKKTLPPPRPDSKSDFDCKYCEYSDICHASPVWDNPKLEEMRRKFYPFDGI